MAAGPRAARDAAAATSLPSLLKTLTPVLLALVLAACGQMGPLTLPGATEVTASGGPPAAAGASGAAGPSGAAGQPVATGASGESGRSGEDAADNDDGNSDER